MGSRWAWVRLLYASSVALIVARRLQLCRPNARGITVMTYRPKRAHRILSRLFVASALAGCMPGLDAGGGGEKDFNVQDPVGYANQCVAELGEIPFFKKIVNPNGDVDGHNDYETYNCLESTPIPTTVTTVENGAEKVTYSPTSVRQCDNPQYIYGEGCEPSAVDGTVNGPRVARRTNDKGTEWVLLCRKSQPTLGQYRDIAMIGHNPLSGKTCFFQNPGGSSLMDATRVPHPADNVSSPASPEMAQGGPSQPNGASGWDGSPQGGLESGMACARCHDADPFVHTPWIDQAMQNGHYVVPRMNDDDDFPEGANDRPYTIIGAEKLNWTIPNQVTDPRASACTSCHRMGTGGFLDRDRTLERRDAFLERMFWDQEGHIASQHAHDRTTEAYRSNFERVHWMPRPERRPPTFTEFQNSEFMTAIEFLLECGKQTNDARNGRPLPTGDALCQTGPLPSEPALDNKPLPEIALEGPDLSRTAARYLGARVSEADGSVTQPTRRCGECHAVTQSGLRHWAELTVEAFNRKNDNGDDAQIDPSEDSTRYTDETARRRIDHLRTDPASETSVYASTKLGIMATGVQYGYFQNLFRKAYGENGWQVRYTQFKNRVSMPKGNHPSFNAEEFATVLKWFKSATRWGDLPDLDVVIDPPPPRSIEQFVNEHNLAQAQIAPGVYLSAEAQAYIEDMRADGWGAFNHDSHLLMLGCAPDEADARNCLQDRPEVTATFGNGAGTLRQLTELTFGTSYWSRSSADGRFVGNGGGDIAGATMTDLLNNVNIGIDASYDPGFFPNNSGFIFQTGGMCRLSLLQTLAMEPVAEKRRVNFDEPECIRPEGVDLYQHVAAQTGGDNFIINAPFTSDPGGADEDPDAHWGMDSEFKFTVFALNGERYQQLPPEIHTRAPFEGDAVLSPSTGLIISRIASSGEDNRATGLSLGYVLRRLVASKNPAYDVTNPANTETPYVIPAETPIVGFIDMKGAKANISFDERFAVTHHYARVDGQPDQPRPPNEEEEEEGGGTSRAQVGNIYLVDLLTGSRYQITNMPPNAEAIFPHFRSDGWFYFLVNHEGKQYMVASDAAVRLAAGEPLGGEMQP